MRRREDRFSISFYPLADGAGEGCGITSSLGGVTANHKKLFDTFAVAKVHHVKWKSIAAVKPYLHQSAVAPYTFKYTRCYDRPGCPNPNARSLSFTAMPKNTNDPIRIRKAKFITGGAEAATSA
jgi:hypothetical protein